MSVPSNIPEKKPYTPPQMVVYGSLTEMTRSATPNGNSDGGSNPNLNRT
jgi:hypothetical protein